MSREIDLAALETAVEELKRADDEEQLEAALHHVLSEALAWDHKLNVTTQTDAGAFLTHDKGLSLEWETGFHVWMPISVYRRPEGWLEREWGEDEEPGPS